MAITKIKSRKYQPKSAISATISLSFNNSVEADITSLTTPFEFSGDREVIVELIPALNIAGGTQLTGSTSDAATRLIEIKLNVDGTTIARSIYTVPPVATGTTTLHPPKWVIPAGTIAAGSKVVKLRNVNTNAATSLQVQNYYLRVSEGA